MDFLILKLQLLKYMLVIEIMVLAILFYIEEIFFFVANALELELYFLMILIKLKIMDHLLLHPIITLLKAFLLSFLIMILLVYLIISIFFLII